MKPFAMTDPAGIYTGVFCAAGLLAYLWMLLPESMRPSKRYVVTDVQQTGGALAITMAPKGRGIAPMPGQFGILRFTGSGKAEPHPFSFSGIGTDSSLRVTIKGLGDFTNGLPGAISPGHELQLQGPFGRFRHPAKGRQVWVAGGIGITPFVTWAQALPSDAAPVDLFYCVKSRDEAPHLSELEELTKAKTNLTLHLVISGVGQRLTAQTIADHVGADMSGVKLAFCGPVALRRALQDGLRRHGVTARNFHYEEFEFRTGIGLKRLARWVLNRSAKAKGNTEPVQNQT